MKELLLTLLIGIIAGMIDVLPMIKMKLDKYSIVSAFVHYLIASFIIFRIELGMAWWIKGGAITLLLALPVIILVMKENKKSVLPMVIMSIVLGTIMGVTEYFVL